MCIENFNSLRKKQTKLEQLFYNRDKNIIKQDLCF